jgi:signal transduction histidine kinase
LEVRVARDPAGVGIVVGDDGVGFDPDRVVRGLGLDNIRERAERAGGSVAVESAPGTGTTVRVALPD